MSRNFRKALLALLLATPAAVHAEWREASTDHFVIYSEASAKDLEAYATRLERFDKAVRYTRGLADDKPSPSNRLTVFVVPNARAVQKVFGDKVQNVAGFYSGRASGSIAITPREFGSGMELDMSADTVLFHEYAHHLMLANYPGAFPAWFIEGFAEFNAAARVAKDGTVSLGLAANHRAYSLAAHNPLPVEKMMSAGVLELNERERSALYSRGWLLTHFLTFEPTRAGQLSAYVRALNSGTPSLDAAKRVFGDLNKLERELTNYLHRSTLTGFVLSPDKISIGPVRVRALSPGASAVMNLRIRSKRGVDRDGAKALLPLVRQAAAPYANDPLVQVTLAEAEYDAGNYAEAEAAADRALAADPKYVEALVYKGRARMALAGEKQDPAAWKEARKWIIAANKLEPDDPEPLQLYYESFLQEGAKPTAAAVLGLERALELAPQDRGLRMTFARQMLIDGKAAEARAALAPLAFDPHAGGMGKFVGTIIQAIDSGGAKAALDIFHKGPPKEEEKKG